MIKRILRAGINYPIRQYRRRTASSTILESHSSAIVKGIGVALRETLRDTAIQRERDCWRLIEERRCSLSRSRKSIRTLDYGAGQAGSRRTKAEMEHGVELTARVSSICRASKPAFWARFLFKLIRNLRPSSCLELGSCVGKSAAYQAAALQLNGRGTLVTIEGAPAIAEIAQETVNHLRLDNVRVIAGPFRTTLCDAMAATRPIDFFFNDGHHDGDAVIAYFNQAFPSLSRQSTIVFDDISWSPSMRAAWNKIEMDERVSTTIDFDAMGIAVINKDATAKDRFRIPL